MSILRRLAGAGLLLAAYLPLHGLLHPGRTGPAGAATREAAETAWVLGLSGSVIALTFAWLLARIVPVGDQAPDRLGRLTARLTAPGATVFAVAVGTAVAVLAGLVALVVHGGRPTSVDEMAQLLHAAAVAGGRTALPLEGSPAAWVVQNGIVTETGWASIYPPLHTLLLSLGMTTGAVWATGPLLAGVATGCFTRAAEDILGPVPGRLAGLLLAASPFWLLLAGSQSSHVAAAAGLSLVLLAGLRAREGGTGWALGTGAAIGFAVTARPWIGLVSSVALLVALWWDELRTRPVLGRGAAVVAGGAPFAALLLWWNDTLFGSPWRLGYSAAFGPAHGLGFHTDPWGNRYGVVEAVAYTGADLLQLGVRLFESPLPALALVGGALLVRPLGRGAVVFGAWAGAGLVAALLYWHHGIQFGPRMLYETVPAWSALYALAATSLLGVGPDVSAPAPRATSRRFARWTVLVAVVGGLALTPSRIRSVAARPDGPPTPEPPRTPAVVFVHGSWASRISARLVGSGMRRDSVETALRRNDVCAVDGYARWRADPERRGSAPPLDFEPLPGTPEHLEIRLLSEGNAARMDPTEAFGPVCAREARADRFGILDLEPLAWRLPPLEGRPVRVARDLGPGGNLPVLDTVEGTPFLLVHRDDAGPLLMGYAEGMELLWGGAAGAAEAR